MYMMEIMGEVETGVGRCGKVTLFSGLKAGVCTEGRKGRRATETDGTKQHAK